MNCQIEFVSSDSDVGTLCGKPAVSTIVIASPVTTIGAGRVLDRPGFQSSFERFLRSIMPLTAKPQAPGRLIPDTRSAEEKLRDAKASVRQGCSITVR